MTRLKALCGAALSLCLIAPSAALAGSKSGVDGTLDVSVVGASLDTPQATTTGGATALCTGQIKATATACGSAAAHQVYSYVLDNSGNTAGTWFQIFDMAVGSVTLGTTVAARQIVVSAGSQMVIPQPVGDAYASQITIACTTTPTGLTPPTANCTYTVFGK